MNKIRLLTALTFISVLGVSTFSEARIAVNGIQSNGLNSPNGWVVRNGVRMLNGHSLNGRDAYNGISQNGRETNGWTVRNGRTGINGLKPSSNPFVSLGANPLAK